MVGWERAHPRPPHVSRLVNGAVDHDRAASDPPRPAGRITSGAEDWSTPELGLQQEARMRTACRAFAEHASARGYVTRRCRLDLRRERRDDPLQRLRGGSRVERRQHEVAPFGR